MIKEYHLFEVLSQIAIHFGSMKHLVFKGGTALNKVYLGELQRFSEDLDFDLGTESLQEVRELCSRIAEVIRKAGYTTSKPRGLRGTIQFDCIYGPPTDHIRVDISAKKIITEKPLVEDKPAVSIYTQRYASAFNVYALEDLVARKMAALADRSEGKDLYDVHTALPLCGELKGPIRKMLESEGAKETPEEFIHKTIANAKRADHMKLKKLTNSFIPRNLRPRDWLELKNDLVFKLEQLL